MSESFTVGNPDGGNPALGAAEPVAAWLRSWLEPLQSETAELMFGFHEDEERELKAAFLLRLRAAEQKRSVPEVLPEPGSGSSNV